jgi:hypothetical protein
MLESNFFYVSFSKLGLRMLRLRLSRRGREIYEEMGDTMTPGGSKGAEPRKRNTVSVFSPTKPVPAGLSPDHPIVVEHFTPSSDLEKKMWSAIEEIAERREKVAYSQFDFLF